MFFLFQIKKKNKTYSFSKINISKKTIWDFFPFKFHFNLKLFKTCWQHEAVRIKVIKSWEITDHELVAWYGFDDTKIFQLNCSTNHENQQNCPANTSWNSEKSICEIGMLLKLPTKFIDKLIHYMIYHLWM